MLSEEKKKKKKETTMWTNNETMEARRRMQAYWKQKGDKRFSSSINVGNRLPLTGWKHHLIMDYGVARLGMCQVCPKKEIRYLHILRHPGYANIELQVGCSHALFLCTGDERCNIYCPCAHFIDEWKRYWDLRQISPMAKPVINMLGRLSTEDYGMVKGGFVVPNEGSLCEHDLLLRQQVDTHKSTWGSENHDPDYKDIPLPIDEDSDSEPEKEEAAAPLPDMTEDEILADLKDYNPRLWRTLIPSSDHESESEKEEDPSAPAPAPAPTLRRSKRKRVPHLIKDLGPLLPDRSSRRRRTRVKVYNQDTKRQKAEPVIRTSSRIKAKKRTATPSPPPKRKRVQPQQQPKTPAKRKRARMSPMRVRRKLILSSSDSSYSDGSDSDSGTTRDDHRQLDLLIKNQAILTQALLNQQKASQQRTQVMQVIASGLAEITKNLITIFENRDNNNV